jgi:hypothetical protein
MEPTKYRARKLNPNPLTKQGLTHGVSRVCGLGTEQGVAFCRTEAMANRVALALNLLEDKEKRVVPAC